MVRPHCKKGETNDQRIHASRDDHRAGGLCRDPERHSEGLGLRAQPAPRPRRESRRRSRPTARSGALPRRRVSRRRSATSSISRSSTRTSAPIAWRVTPTSRAWRRSSTEAIAAVREGRPIADAKLEALRQFAAKVTRQRGVVSEADVVCLQGRGLRQSCGARRARARRDQADLELHQPPRARRRT